MKFDELYTDAKDGFESPVYGIIRGGKQNTCWHCGSPTNWFDLSFLAYFCSVECLNAKWDEYLKACSSTEEPHHTSALKVGECYD